MMGQGRRKKKREMRENEEEGQPEGAPNLPNVLRLFRDKLGWTAGFPRGAQREDSWGCSPA